MEGRISNKQILFLKHIYCKTSEQLIYSHMDYSNGAVLL